jgi:hypothetical protein
MNLNSTVGPSRLLCFIPIASTATSACIAPRVEIYTLLACMDKKPEYMGRGPEDIPISVDLGGTQNWDPFSSSSPQNDKPRILSDYLDYVDTDNGSRSDSLLLNFPHYDYTLASRLSLSDTRNQKCSSDPTVLAAAAKLIAGMRSHETIL